MRYIIFVVNYLALVTAFVACRSFSLWQTKGRLRQSKAGLRQTKRILTVQL